MTKQAEQAYLSMIGEAARRHALDKPFSDPRCGEMLAGLGTIMQLLPPPPARVLDLGCGTGWTSAFLALRGWHVVGQDIAPDMLALARENRQRWGAENLDFAGGDYEQLAFDAEFDAALFYDSLHHCDDEEAALRAVHRALKAGGVVVAHEPGDGHSRHPDSVRAMQQFGVNERDMPPSRIIAAARKVGFRHWRVMPMPASLHQAFYGAPLQSRGVIAALQRLQLAQPLLLLRMRLRRMHRGAITLLTK